MFRTVTPFVAAVMTLLFIPHAFGQSTFHPDTMETVLYGAAYYPEYMPYERLDKDVELMKQAGITVVRMGESSWGLWEPEDGRFEYAWMDRVVDATIIADLGIDMSVFPTVAQVAAWAGVCPGNNESAGKRMPQQKRRGNVQLASILVQAAFAISRTKDNFLKARF